MLKIIYFSFKTESKLYFFATLLFYFLFFKTIFCQEETCYDYSYLYENGERCFNFLKFDHKRYQSNNFAINKNGDLILELTEYNDEYDAITSSRLFYGLTKEGKYFFSNKSSYTYEFNIDIDEETYDPYEFNNFFEIYNSINLFVSMKNDPNQYLFSINQFNSMVELHNITKENNNYLIWNFNKFFNLDEDDYFFPYECSLFELKKESTYIIVFIPKVNVYEDLKNVNFIKKFRFKSFDKNAYEEIKTVQYEHFLEHNILDTFLMDDSNILVVVSYFESEEEKEINPEEINHRRLSSPSRRLNYFKFVLNFYNNNLRALTYIKDLELDIGRSDDYNPFEFEGEVLLKSIYLRNKYVFFILYNKDSFYFNLNYIDYSDYKNKRITMILEQPRNNYPYDFYDSSYNFVKINEKRIVFFYTSRLYGEDLILVILIIDIYLEEEYEYEHEYEFSEHFVINEFSIYLYPFIPKMQISTYLYNGYLLFSSTFITQEENDNSEDYSTNYFSLFMIFGYVNGTDRIENIYNYLSNHETFEEENVFFNLLTQNRKIENNIYIMFQWI